MDRSGAVGEPPEPPLAGDAAGLLRPRWRGQAGRLEVWYGTFSDSDTGDGLWLHHEVVAPLSSGSRTVAWAASFPTDGPALWSRTEAIGLGTTGSAGSAGDISWDLSWDLATQQPLYTFPRWAWEKELLPGAQVVAAPTLAVSGLLGGRRFSGTGALSRIYGHGNASRWGWLHADLGDGDVLELVSAVSTRRGLRSLPPITHLRYRIGGHTAPGFQGPSIRLRSKLELPTWTIRGHAGVEAIEIVVHQPPGHCVSIPYEDPDGRTATCVNTERADVDVRIGGRAWHLEGSGHAEIGTRP